MKLLLRLLLSLFIIAVADLSSGCSRQEAAGGIRETEPAVLTASPAPAVPAVPSPSPGAQSLAAVPAESSPQSASYLHYSLNSNEGWRMEVAGLGMFSADNALFKTDDGGVTWRRLADSASGSLPSEAVSEMLFTSSSRGWMTVNTPRGGYSGLFRSDNGGESWSLVKLEDTPESLYSVEMPVFFPETHYGILQPKDIAEEDTIFWLTDDDGDNWEAISSKPSGTWKELKWTVHSERGNSSWEIEIGGTKQVYDGGNSFPSS
ncbi:WD40/YVTN/BNR-like repeat-containing protein [Paenibacillus tengchongensis]|uniref:WD40/YVTN/BNR-like repeat-containing protein n=1 Tax=Paenibacillus tengchongensis TaxID=2608684 RepID=UPI00124BD9F6|nr:hypothetical protein [Paenibacillus tengchongensis]